MPRIYAPTPDCEQRLFRWSTRSLAAVCMFLMFFAAPIAAEPPATSSSLDTSYLREFARALTVAAIATMLLIAAFALLRLARRRLRSSSLRLRHPAWIAAVVANNFSIERIQTTLLTAMRVTRFVIACALLYVYVPFVMSQFPLTRLRIRRGRRCLQTSATTRSVRRDLRIVHDE